MMCIHTCTYAMYIPKIECVIIMMCMCKIMCNSKYILSPSRAQLSEVEQRLAQLEGVVGSTDTQVVSFSLSTMSKAVM